MPTGNSHYLPSGIWYEQPSNPKISRLLLRSFGKFSCFCLIIYGLQSFRDFQRKYAYKTFVGRMMTIGTFTLDTHEPLSVEEIDRLKAAEKSRKEQARKNFA